MSKVIRPRGSWGVSECCEGVERRLKSAEGEITGDSLVNGKIKISFLSVTQQQNLGLHRLVSEVPRSHTHTVELLRTSDQHVAEAATYTTQTNTRYEHPCHQRDSNLQSQWSTDRRSTPETARPPGSA